MPLSLDVDGAAWRDHLRDFTSRTPGLVPVVKGNGYGFGRGQLAAEAESLGADLVAVSDPVEIAGVRRQFSGTILVMAPWRAHQDEPESADPGVMRSLGHPAAVRALTGYRRPVVVEGVTSMRRHGLTAGEFEGLLPELRALQPAGLALHLPLDRPHGSDPVGQVRQWIDRYARLGAPPATVWVSHLRRAEVEELQREHPGVSFRPRIGTDLWLGQRGLMRAHATVLDVRPIRPGDRFGYRQQRARRAAVLVVVSAGTAHGVGLESPAAPRGLVGRGKQLARGALEAGGWSLSPFTVDGRQRWFAEPPHMQVSMLLLPASETAPEVGEEVRLEARLTTTTFDQIRGLDE